MKPNFVKKVSLAVDNFFTPSIKFLSKIRVTANHITFLQVPFVILMFFMLLFQKWYLALTLLFITLVLDVYDGAFARIAKQMSKRGKLYDKAMDLFGITAFLLGLALSMSALVLVCLVLLLITVAIYVSNEYAKPEVYCGVRSFGALGLLVNQVFLFLTISIILGVALLIYKGVANYVKG